MPQFIIQGPQKVSGEIKVAGAKNAALIAIPAALLMKSVSLLSNVPKINDVDVMLDIAKELGIGIVEKDHTIEIDAADIRSTKIPSSLSGKSRASVMFVGPLLLRQKEVSIGYPGGCSIGRRPIDQFIDGFKAFGAKIEDTGESYKFVGKDLHSAEYFFPFVSVTATQALMMTAALIPGKTILKNTAMEPEVQALANHLNKCGAKISGIGGSTLAIEGVPELKSQPYEMIPDRLEAGMFAILAAAARGSIKINQCHPEHIESLLTIFDQIGVKYNKGKDWLEVLATDNEYLSPERVVTHEYPGLATDLQPPLTVLLTQTKGLTLVHETIFEKRLLYTDLLNRMGANIILCDPHRVLVQGTTALRGKKIESPDIRSGIAMLIAGLIAKGETIIDNIYQIERGFENIEERLRVLGIKIKRVE